MGLASARLGRHVRSLIAVGVAVLFAACTGAAISEGASNTDPVGTTASKVIGTQGGTLGTSSGNAKVNIPAGAVAGTSNLTVAVVPASQAPKTSATAKQVASSVYDFSPNGTQFAKPASMAIKTSMAPGPNQKAVLAYLDNTSQTWQVLPNSTYDASTSTVTAPVTHFTIFAVIIVAADGTGCTEQLNPNTYCAPQMCSTSLGKCAAVPSSFALGGVVSGLNGTLTLSDATGGQVTVAADGNFVFPTALSDATAYNVQVAQQPAGQQCSVVGGQGTVAGAAVSNIVVNCLSAYAIGGSVSGMLDSSSVGLVNGNDTLTVAGNSNFVFALSQVAGSPYNVTVATQPNFQSCLVSNGNGTLGNANVTQVSVNCTTNTYTLGGHVAGLRPLAGIALQNGNDMLTVSNGVYTFPTPVTYGSNYNVIFSTPVGYACGFDANVVGNANMAGQAVTSIDITCALLPYTVSGNVSGLVSSALVTLENGVDVINATNGNYTFPTPLDLGDAYDVHITSPTGEVCNFDFGVTSNGNMPAANINDVNVVCVPQPYSLGVAVSGLVLGANVLVSNGNDSLHVTNGNGTFPTAVAYGSNYNVTFVAPAGQSCGLVGSGPLQATMPPQNLTNLALVCAPNTYGIHVNVTGLANNANLSLFSGSDTPAVGNGNTAFATPVAYGSPYSVSLSPPPGENCQFSGGGNVVNGTMGVAPVSLSVTCRPMTYRISGTVTGLLASTNVALANGNDTLTVANGAYAFPTAVAFGGNYNVQLTPPVGQVCSWSASPNGVMGAQNVTLNAACTLKTYTVSAQVSGLLNNANVTLTNGADSLSAGNGANAFPTLVAYNSNYAVGVGAVSGQSCVAVSPNGVVGNANVSVAVNCTPNKYALSGNVTGLLANTNVILANGNDTLSATNGAYSFPTSVAFGGNYNAQLTSPAGQICSWNTSPNGVVGAQNTTLNVSCTLRTYSLSAQVSGLLNNANVTLTNGADTLSAFNGTNNFPTLVAYNSNYAVGVGAVTGQSCVAVSPNGVMSNANATVAVNCTPIKYALSGNITGLLANVNLSLQNGNDSLSAGNGTYTMPLSVPYASPWAITYPQPVGQTCNTSNANGIMSNANVTNVNIGCTTNTYTIRGTVAGLVGGQNVILTNGSDTVNITNGNYTFATQVAYQSNYNIVITQPTGQNCNVVAGQALSGIMSVGNINVAIACQPNTYVLGGQVAGLVSAANVTLHNGNDTLSANNGPYSLPTHVAYAGGYNVTVANATGQSCSIANANGIMPNNPLSNANITCVPNHYSVFGQVAGLVTGNVTLGNGSDSISVANGNAAFPTQVAYNSNYAVTFTNPSGHTCVVASPNGVVGGGNVYVAVSCVPNPYTISGAVTGLVANANVTMRNGNDSIGLYNGAYTMPTAVAFNANYAISAQSPAGQVCTLGANANGTMGPANVSGVNASCTQLSYSLKGVVTGLVNNNQVSVSNGNDANYLTSNGNYTLPTPVVYNGNYALTVASPAGQTCTATSPNGVMAAGAATVNINCVTNPYQLGGTVVGLINGTNLTVYNGNDALTATNGNYVLPTPVKYFSSYALSVAAPAGQLCAFAGNPNGVMGSQNITSMEIDCQPATYMIGGSVSGLVTGMVGITSGSDNIQAGNANFTLPSQIAYQSSYAVSLTSPSGQTCVVQTGVASGTMGAGNVTLGIKCTPKTYWLGGRVSGLLANTNVTLYNGNDTVSSPNGVYQLPTSVAYFSNYNVTLVNPVGQTCALNANHAGVMPSKSVTNANVTCVQNTYTLAGTVSGLLNNAQVTVLSGNDSVPSSNGSYSLPTPITYQQNYNVSLVSPAGQSCSVTGGAPAVGTMNAANVGNVLIACTPNLYTVGGHVSGLVAGGNVTVTSANDTFTTTNGDYNMPVSIAYFSGYSYQAASPSGQNCNWVLSGNNKFTGVMGAGAVHNANLTCAPLPYTLGGSVSGLLPGTSVVLTSGSDSPSVSNQSYAFNTPISYNSNYAVSLAQPTGQNCAFVGNGNSGVMPASAVGNVNVTCTPLAYPLGGSVAGLINNANVVVTNGNDSVTLYNGAYTFATQVAYTSSYNIGITSPAGQSCTFATAGNGNGAMPANALSNRNITCVQLPYALGGNVTGLLANSNVTLTNGNDTLSAWNGNYTFPTQVVYGGNYNVSLASPTGHSCVFANANNANMVAGGVSNLNVNCNVIRYALGGNVTGLVGSVSLVNGNDSLTLSATGTFNMPKSPKYMSNYNVVVSAQPATQLCTVTGGTGVMSNANVTGIGINCVNAYAVGGSVSGLPVDTNVQLASATSSDTLNVSWTNPNFMMPQVIAAAGNYNVVVASQPPGLHCTASNNAGSISNANIVNVAVACTLQLSFMENQNAALVLGQSNFTSSTSGTTSTTLHNPSGPVYLAANGNIYVSDTGNKRILAFNGRPQANGQAAAFAIGQTDMNTTATWTPTQPRANTDAAQGGAGNANVTAFADSYSSRVLLYVGSPNSNVGGTIALGQNDLVTGTPGCSATNMNAPAAVWVNNSNFFVADTKNHRVLIWLSQPASSGVAADIVVGQPNMTTCGLAASVNANNLNSPQGVWANGSVMVVADTLNNRLLVWNLSTAFPGAMTNRPADEVIGQPDFFSNDTSDPTTTMYQPASVTSDGTSLFVAERFNNRVSAWAPIFGAAFEYTLGQANIANSVCNAGSGAASNTLCTPSGISVVGTSLYVTDYGNNRVVVYKSN